ncbi:MAG TPA: PRC-barrel domain-containing protein [Microvirga sp.]|nr:PRC-barrel domain-containing protein [Microvirga sp.]
MLKKHMAACLVATAFAAMPALAQTPPPPPSAGTDRPVASGSGSTTGGSPAMQPGAASGTTGAPTTATGPSGGGGGSPQVTASPSGSAQGQFLTQLQPNQMMASRLIGTTVVGANNESIGDVNDVIVDRNGQAIAAVIGVGGFLGIGEKDVAVPFQQLDFVSSQQAAGGTPGTATGGGQPSTGVTTTGSTGASQGGAGEGGVPDRILLRTTKAELQAAPTFTRSGRGDRGNNPGSAGGGGNTSAPRQ